VGVDEPKDNTNQQDKFDKWLAVRHQQNWSKNLGYIWSEQKRKKNQEDKWTLVASILLAALVTEHVRRSQGLLTAAPRFGLAIILFFTLVLILLLLARTKKLGQVGEHLTRTSDTANTPQPANLRHFGVREKPS
jgi:hypothetical protein